MIITIDESDSRPIYRQVADEIKALIVRGELIEGTVLPPVRQLAGHLGVNLNTIAMAYRELQQEGMVSIRHGSGAVVTSLRTSEADDGRRHKQLKAAVTELVVAGWTRERILEAVFRELDGIFRSH